MKRISGIQHGGNDLAELVGLKVVSVFHDVRGPYTHVYFSNGYSATIYSDKPTVDNKITVMVPSYYEGKRSDHEWILCFSEDGGKSVEFKKEDVWWDFWTRHIQQLCAWQRRASGTQRDDYQSEIEAVVGIMEDHSKSNIDS